MNCTRIIAGLIALTASSAALPAADEAAALGKTLTPVGAESVKNKAGTIPAWSGGYTKVPAGFVPGGRYPDPFSEDKPLYTISAANFDSYKANLSPGQVALLQHYPDWKMPVYTTRRSAAYPQGVYAETRANVGAAHLAAGGNGVTGTTGGIPFPLPRTGLEVIWNHILQYRGDTYATSWAQAAVSPGGSYTLVQFDYELDYAYGNQKKKPAQREDNLIVHFLQIIRQPPRLAGTILLVNEYADQVKQPREAWSYNPGQRRVRLAPNVAYDNPGTAADGLRTNDDFGMYNGATDRYDWKLVGKQELYVPYNSYALNNAKVADVLKPNHVNPDLARYELHRVWVVDAVLKPGTRHIYKRRTFYVDEDSWSVLVEDKYDNHDQLWRVDEDHRIEYYDLPMLAPGIEVKHDLQSGRYLAMHLLNEEGKVYNPIVRKPSDFTPNTLRDKGTR